MTDLSPHSPAERSGINKGDIILELNGAPMGDSQELRLKISMMAPGANVKLKLLRHRQERDIAVTLAEAPTKPESEVGPAWPATPGPHLGISVGQLSPQIVRQLGLPPETTGVVVMDVTTGSSAEEGRLLRNDVIQEVNRKPIATVDQFQRAIQAAGNQPVLLLINRGGDHLYTVVPAR